MGLFNSGGLVPPSTPSTGVLTGMKRSIPVYTLPSSLTTEQLKDIMTVMVVYGTSTDRNAKMWQTWVFTWVCLAFPGMESRFAASKSKEYIFTPLPASFIEEVSQLVARLTVDTDLTLEVPEGYGFPVAGKQLSVDFYNCGSIKGLYGYFALIVHLMGKQIRASNRELITMRRPQNIIDKYQATEEAFILTGLGRMSDIAHEMVKTAWDQCSALRKVTIDELCRMRGSEEISSDIVFTMFRMLEYAHMANAGFIRDFLNSCDWVLRDMPSMKPAFDVYVESVYAFAAEPPTRRPYVKLYYGDNTTIFHGKTLQDLTAIAVEWLKVNNDSLTGYTAPGGEKAKVAFARLCMARGIDLVSATLGTPAVVAPEEDTEGPEV